MKPKRIESTAPRPLANYNEAFHVGDFVSAAGKIVSDFNARVSPEGKNDSTVS